MIRCEDILTLFLSVGRGRGRLRCFDRFRGRGDVSTHTWCRVSGIDRSGGIRIVDCGRRRHVGFRLVCGLGGSGSSTQGGHAAHHTCDRLAISSDRVSGFAPCRSLGRCGRGGSVKRAGHLGSRGLGGRSVLRLRGFSVASATVRRSDGFNADGGQGRARLGVYGLARATTSLPAVFRTLRIGFTFGVGLFAGTRKCGGSLVSFSGAGEEPLAATDGRGRHGLGELGVRVTGGLDDLAQRGLGDDLRFVRRRRTPFGEFTLTVSHRAAAGTLRLAAGRHHAGGVSGVLGALARTLGPRLTGR